MDWKALGSLVAAAGAAGVSAGVLSLQTNPVAPWQVHAGNAGAGALLYVVGRLQQKPALTK